MTRTEDVIAAAKELRVTLRDRAAAMRTRNLYEDGSVDWERHERERVNKHVAVYHAQTRLCVAVEALLAAEAFNKKRGTK